MPAPVVPPWAAAATASVQQPASKAYQIQLPSGQQVEAMGQQLLQSIVQGIMQVLDGYILPNTQPTEQLAQWNTDFQTAITTLRDDFTAGSDAFTTLLQSWQTALADYTSWSTFISAVQSAWNTYTTTVTGLESSEIFTIQQLLDSMFGITSTGQTSQTKIASSGSGPSLATDLEDAWDWLTGTSSSPSTSASSAVAAAALPNIPAGSGPGQSEDLLTHLNNVAAVTNSLGASALASALQSMTIIANTLDGLSAKVQNQLTQTSGQTNSGKFFQVPFSVYPNGSFSVAPFNVTYTGSGTGDLAISGGDAVWNAVNNGDVSALALFNNGGSGQAYTDTDYQEMQATLAGLPNGAGSLNFAILRSNAAGSTYVYGVVYLSTGFQLDWEIGCYVAGVQTVFASGTNAPLNLNFTMLAGVGGNPYRFQGIAGDTIVFDYTDTAHVSQLGASYRYWGFRSDTYNSGRVTPAPASYVGCSDNSPPSIPGSGFHAYCSSSTPVVMSNTTGTILNFPAGYFDTTSESSVDMTPSGSGATPSCTVANPGRYIVNIRSDMQFAASLGMVTICPAIQRYNSAGTLVETRLLDGNGVAFNIDTIQDYTSHFGGMCAIACLAGDSLEPCYYLDGLGTPSSLKFLGEASGSHSYWDVTLANWSLA